ncbi:MAG: metal ABC transporter substrate-binding protein [bacterium]
MKKILAVFLVLFGVSAVSACTPATTEYDFYATVYPVVYLIDEIADGTGLTVSMVPGITSHQTTTDWSSKEIIGMTKASLLFYVGANLDAYIENQIDGVFENLYIAGRLVKIEDSVPFMEGIIHDHVEEEDAMAADEPSALGHDPHFWVSPKMMIEVAAVILEKMIWAYPEYEADFTANAATVVAALNALADRYQAAIDAGTKVMMTSTNLYGYLGDTNGEAEGNGFGFGLHTISISPGYHEEPDQLTVPQRQAIVDEAILHGIRYIVFEKSASSPISEAVVSALNEAGLTYVVARVEFNIMSTVPEAGLDYIQVMDANLTAIVTATEIYSTVTQIIVR